MNQFKRTHYDITVVQEYALMHNVLRSVSIRMNWQWFQVLMKYTIPLAEKIVFRITHCDESRLSNKKYVIPYPD
jgi:hypothetical protein